MLKTRMNEIPRTLFKYVENKYLKNLNQKENMRRTNMKKTNPKRKYEAYKLFIASR